MSILRYEVRGNLLLIQQYPLHLYYELSKCFSYDRIGYDRIEQKKTKTPETVATGFDAGGKSVYLGPDMPIIPKTIVTFHGFLPKILEFAKKHKLKVDGLVTQVTDPSVYVPKWENVPEDFEFRYMQREVLEIMAKTTGGIIVCAPGYGKSECVGLMSRIFPEARILISSFRQQVYSTIAERVRKYLLPGTKYFVQKAGKAITQHAVQQASVVVCGNKSLPKILSYGDDYDFYINDECHLAAAPDTFRIISSLSRPRIFGFTASPNRSDGAQFRLLGLFGPKLLEVDMKKAREKGMVVPILVKWCPVYLQYDPVADCHAAYKKHRAIWHNAARNRLIAGAANSYDEDTQVLIIVETIKHAMALRHLLPNYFVASSETPNLDKIRNAFKKGTMKKIIATGVFREGVDFKNLQVLINGTGVRSEIANIQLTGRVTRTADGKERGIVHDFFDHFNQEFKYFSSERKKLYNQLGYEQVEIQPTELLKNG